MGLNVFGSESSSETSTTTQNAAFSEIGGAVTSLNLSTGKKSKYTTVNVLDGGAVAGAFSFANSALKQVELAGAQSAAGFKEAISAVLESSRGEGENVTLTVVKWAALVGIVYFAVRAFRG